MTKYTQLTSCTGWYYVSKDHSGAESTVQVAAWAELENGNIVGLIPVTQMRSNNEAPYPRLVSPPNGDGAYVPEAKLTLAQRMQVGL